MSVTELHAAQPEPTMVDLEVWVTEWFTTILERRAGNRRRWCARWFVTPRSWPACGSCSTATAR
jgi:hypothetical protein